MLSGDDDSYNGTPVEKRDRLLDRERERLMDRERERLLDREKD